ncbi:hypothetical protein [Pseudonocardia sp.]|uniref:hypothetical protein n=1 Tax=Pseudonocardia sp. TaxID=60912 RepID=UPI003D0C592C
MSEKTDRARMRDAYAATTPPTRTPTPFIRDEKIEAVLARRAADPAWFDGLDPTVRVAIGHYETAKAAAEHPPPPDAA